MKQSFVAGDSVVDKGTGKTGAVIAPPANDSVQFGRTWVRWDGGDSEQVEISRLRRQHPGIAASEAMLKEFGIDSPKKGPGVFSADNGE